MSKNTLGKDAGKRVPMLSREDAKALVIGLAEELRSSDVTSVLLGLLCIGEQVALVDDIIQDHLAVVSSDPSCRGLDVFPLVENAPYRAVVAYRMGHALWRSEGTRLKTLAVALQHLARVRTGIDIHPAAEIGRRLVIDHGTGTVIGETASLGNDAYLLNGVILGARGIAANPTGKRHPTVGDRVQIGSFARILGPITVGDDVFIGPMSLVVQDLPSHVRVAADTAKLTIRYLDNDAMRFHEKRTCNAAQPQAAAS